MHKSVKKRIYFAIFSFLIIALIGGLLVWQLQKNMVFFYTPTEATLQSGNNNIWLGGLVKSYDKKEENNQIIHLFTITDGVSDIEVEYSGGLPSLFRVGQGAVIYGKIINGTLYANRVAVKHDEVYMTKESYQRIRKSI